MFPKLNSHYSGSTDMDYFLGSHNNLFKNSQPQLLHFLLSDWLKKSSYQQVTRVLPYMEDGGETCLQFYS